MFCRNYQRTSLGSNRFLSLYKTVAANLALFLLSAAYVLPGLFGRDPWRSADVTAFGYIVNIAQGKTSWLAPTVGGLAADGALLPYWIGAVFVRLLSPMVDPALAARIPFALLLVLALSLTWYAAYHLARSESAQPLPFAFGGEADPVDYARAIADGALLALIASLGLLQLGHETTPELVQLVAVALFLYGLAAAPHHPLKGAPVAAIAIVVLAASGAPSIAMLLALFGSVTLSIAHRRPAWRDIAWLAIGAFTGAVARPRWRVGEPPRGYHGPGHAIGLVRQIAWFAWPACCWRCGRCGSGVVDWPAGTSSCRSRAPRPSSASGWRWPEATAP